MRNRGLVHWLPTYAATWNARRRLKHARRRQLTHLLFLVCDHFEPKHGAVSPDQPAQRIEAWREGYRQLQAGCLSRYGTRPLHSWFYPPHHGVEFLPALARFVYDGLGEVELHYHHSGDTEETLRAALTETLSTYRKYGLLLHEGAPPVPAFGFIHGDWALDNSADGEYCGVNSELSLLQELGCWGDLTMPSTNRCQTRKINSIYYGVDDPRLPKSHDWGSDASAGRRQRDGLLLIQGPLGINWRAPKYPRIENASLTTSNWGRPDRVRAWIDAHVHVLGRPEWLFIKLHTHGAIEQDFDGLFGRRGVDMHRCLNEEFNDGKTFRLHYVTARQAYNVIRAAEAGHGGDPAQYVDFALGRQVNSAYVANREHRLEACTRESLALRVMAPADDFDMSLRMGAVRRVSGCVEELSSRVESGGRTITSLNGTGITVELDAGTRPIVLDSVAYERFETSSGVVLKGSGPLALATTL